MFKKRDCDRLPLPNFNQDITVQGSYTTGPSKFQDFSRTFKDHIYKNPGPVIARKTETIQTNQQTM